MLGATRETLVGKRLIDFAHPDEDIGQDLAVYREMREGERDHHRVETRYVGPDDEMRWANLVLSLVRGAQEEPQFIIAIVEDVTERKRAHEALIRSEKLATTGRLAASLAHEINNPLQTVIGCLGLAEESMEADEEMDTYVTMAHDELKRAAKIVSRLRDLSRPADVERGEPTDVNALVDSVLEVSRKDLKDRQVCIVRDLQEDLPHPFLMPDRIKQVILNLVLNARDAMSGGGELRLTTAYDGQRDEVVITVSDEGAGIPDDVMGRLFDPFFSTKTEGTGLGLFVSQNIVQEQGGRIDVESTVGEGSTFKVFLPVSP
jgi:PAS domain S-box-containing protein